MEKKHFGQYRITRERIASGATSIIHEAVDAQGRRCALKVLDREKLMGKFQEQAPDRAEQLYQRALQRFKNEYQLLVGLSHPHVAQVYELGLHDRALYIASEFIDGQPLAKYSRRKAPSMLLPLFVQALEGLDFIHRNGLLHLDIKSDNILVQVINGNPHIKVIDFGLSVSMDGYRGEFFGSIPYMAPEVALGHKELVDARADLFSLAVLIYSCITWGELPFPRTKNPQKSIVRDIILREAPPTPPSHVHAKNHSIPDALEKVVMRLLQRDPSRRFYANARAVINALTANNIDAFRDSPDTRAAYLIPERNQHVGRADIQRDLFRDIHALVEGKPHTSIWCIYGEHGLGKTHLLQSIISRSLQFVEQLEIRQFSCPTDESHLQEWSHHMSVILSAPSGPLLIVLDNIDEAQDDRTAFSGIWRYLCQRSLHSAVYEKSRPLMLLCSSSDPQALDRQLAAAGCAALNRCVRHAALSRFDHSDIATFLNMTPALKGKEIPSAWVQRLSRITDGIPSELVSQLQELDAKGLLFGPDGQAVLAAMGGMERRNTHHAPHNTRQRLFEQFTSLTSAGREIVEVLACWGIYLFPRRLSGSEISYLCCHSPILPALHQLTENGILAHDVSDDSYGFIHHEYFPQLIYEQLTLSQREVRHDAISQLLESLPHKTEKEHEALQLHRGLGSNHQEGVLHLFRLGRKLLHQRGYAEISEKVLSHAAAMVPSNQSKLSAMICALRAECAFQEGKIVQGIEHVQRGLTLLQHDPKPSPWMQALLLSKRIPILIREHRFDDAEASISAAQALLAGRSSSLGIICENFRALLLMEHAQLDTKHSHQWLGKARDVAVNALYSECRLTAEQRRDVSNSPLGLIYRMLGDNSRAIALLRSELLRRRQTIFGRFSLAVALAETYRLRRSYELALRMARWALHLAQKMGLPQRLFTAHRVTSNIYHDMDAFESSLREGELGLAASAFLSDERARHHAEIRLYNHLGHCYKELKRWDSAQAAFEAVLARKPMGTFRLSSTEGLGEVLFYSGHTQEAEHYLKEAEHLLHTLPADTAVESYNFRIQHLMAELCLLRHDLAAARRRLPKMERLARRHPPWMREVEALRSKMH